VDHHFEAPAAAPDVLKKITDCLAFAPELRVLVVDDEPEIAGALRDFLESRTAPAFRVFHEKDGASGLRALEEARPDVVVLDIKMPVMDGRAAYRAIRQSHPKLPVIIFYDAVSGDEMVEIYKAGRPAVVDKSGPASRMGPMLTLIKKMAYFG
jgi:two-component system chemotaxis response regulator CheB